MAAPMGVFGSEPTDVHAMTGPTYQVLFSETGLPSGTTWSVTLASVGNVTGVNTTTSSDASTISFDVPSGSYLFAVPVIGSSASQGYYGISGWVDEAPGATASYTGSVDVSGSPVTQDLVFSRDYPVQFEESGLAPGTPWTVALNSSGLSNTTLSTDTSPSGGSAFFLPNGSYDFSVWTPYNSYQASSASVPVDITGSSGTVLETESFSLLLGYYAATFHESGLPADSMWYVGISPLTGSPGLNGSGSEAYLSQTLVNGSYTFRASATDGNELNPNNGTLTIHGADVSVELTTGYPVLFSQTGLQNGTTYWSVEFDGQDQGTTNSSMSFVAPDGSFPYYVDSVLGYFATPASGWVNVNGSEVSVLIEFTAWSSITNYTLSFRESGLSPGTRWDVTVEGGLYTNNANSSTGSSITFAVPNGTYTYAPGKVSGYSTPPSGDVRIDGSNGTVTLNYSTPGPGGATYYPVTFTASGLPASTNWSVDLNATLSGSSTNASLTIDAQDGSYAWLAHAAVNGTTVNTSGSLTVTGWENVSVSFSVPSPPLVSVTFQAAGLASSTDWSVTLTALGNGLVVESLATLTREAGGASAIVFEVSPGGYSYSASGPSGARVDGTVDAHAGTSAQVSVHFGSSPGGPSTLLGPLPGWAAAIGVVVVLIATAGLVLTMRRVQSTERARGHRLVERLGEAEWTDDGSGTPRLRSP